MIHFSLSPVACHPHCHQISFILSEPFGKISSVIRVFRKVLIQHQSVKVYPKLLKKPFSPFKLAYAALTLRYYAVFLAAAVQCSYRETVIRIVSRVTDYQVKTLCYSFQKVFCCFRKKFTFSYQVFYA